MNTTAFSIFIGLLSGAACYVMITSDSNNDDDKIQRRLENIKNRTMSEEKQLKKRISLLVSDTAYQIQFLGKILRHFKLSNKIKNDLFLADSKLQVDTFIFLCIILGLFFSGLIAIKSLLFAPIGIIGCMLPFLILKISIRKRLNLFTQQFPDALNMISSSLRAGHPLMASFETVVQEMPKPVSSVFKTAVDEISLGIDVKEALNSMTKIIPASLDLKFFVTAVLIQREVGGNLAELLDGLSLTIRERFKLLGQLRVQTAQTRFSGYALCVMPPLICIGIFFLSPEYMDPLLHTTQGNTALLIATALIILGLYFIQRISNINI